MSGINRNMNVPHKLKQHVQGRADATYHKRDEYEVPRTFSALRTMACPFEVAVAKHLLNEAVQCPRGVLHTANVPLYPRARFTRVGVQAAVRELPKIASTTVLRLWLP